MNLLDFKGLVQRNIYGIYVGLWNNSLRPAFLLIERIFDSPNERANYAFIAAGLGVLLVLFVTICCCCCEGSNFFTDKPRPESLEVRKMREMRNRIEKDNESGMILSNRKFEKSYN